jgi:RNA polymerase sigma factor (sigma-70 family)
MSGRILRFRPRPAPPRDVPPSSLRVQTPAGLSGAATPSPSASPASRFRALILPHMDSAYSLARYLCRDATAAEDIVQEALLKAFRSFAGYRGGDPKAWLLTIVRNVFFDLARAGRPWVGVVEAGDNLADLPDESQPGAETELIRRSDVAAVRAAVEAIPEPFREALVLREFEELSYAAIAQITGAPLGTVMSRLARARRQLALNMGLGREAAS